MARPTTRRTRRRDQQQQDHQPQDRRHRPAPTRGERIVWPRGLELAYGISAITRWRWEKSGKLPPRDVFIGGRSGWKPETLAAAEQSAS